MKYRTEQLYGINPKELANMRHYDALQKSRQCAVAHLANLVHEDEPMESWSVEKRELVAYLKKAIEWCEIKIDEME